MKRHFSSSWNASVQPRKQRKYRHNAPLHTMHVFLSAPLSKELRKTHSRRSIELRNGDEVTVVRGSHAKKKGKISEVNKTRGFVHIESITRTLRDGSKSFIKFRPNSVVVTGLHLDDKKRLKARVKKASKEESNAPNTRKSKH